MALWTRKSDGVVVVVAVVVVVVVVVDDDDDGQRVRRPLPCTNDVSGLGAPPPPAVSLLIVGVFAIICSNATQHTPSYTCLSIFPHVHFPHSDTK